MVDMRNVRLMPKITTLRPGDLRYPLSRDYIVQTSRCCVSASSGHCFESGRGEDSDNGKNDQEDEKQNLGDIFKSGRNSAETQQPRNPASTRKINAHLRRDIGLLHRYWQMIVQVRLTLAASRGFGNLRMTTFGAAIKCKWTCRRIPGQQSLLAFFSFATQNSASIR